jgi:arylsulfatase A-like enzyme
VVSILLTVVVLFFSSCGTGKNSKPNILLITIDTLRRDHLGVYGYERDTSPFIDKLAKEGVMFKNVVTPQPQTSGSHASILTSLHPLTHNLVFNGLPLDDNVQTIAEVLRKNGYYTIGVIGVKLLGKKYRFEQGFDSFSDRWEKDPLFKGSYQRTAQSVNESLFKQVREYLAHYKNKPLFIWVHYYDPHKPYIDRDHITFNAKLPGDKGNNESIMKYDQEIRYTDDAIRRLYGFLEKNGAARGLVTCITADHGEQFGEHGAMNGHNDFYSETTMVPLVFHGHGVPADKVIDTFVSTMDIGATLLAAANLTFDYPVDGVDLLAHSSGLKQRKFLIIGTQKFARSLQLLGAPFSYIANFDYHYKHWFTGPGNSSVKLDEKRFTAVPAGEVKQYSNDKGKRFIISLPQTRQKGLNYLVFKADVRLEENTRFNLKVKVFPHFFSDTVPVELQSSSLEVIYPVTVVDKLSLHLVFKNGPGANVNNPRYAFIPAAEFPRDRAVNELGYRKLSNKLWRLLLTPRKGSKKDELFDLSEDIAMENNLVDAEDLKPVVMEYKKLIYSAFRYFDEKKHALLNGVLSKKSLSNEEKKMLESLGYL